MRLFIKLLVNAFAVMLTAYVLSGVSLAGYLDAFAVVVVLGIMNTLVKPILQFLALPITILTLGLFALAINALVVLLVDKVVPGFSVSGFWWALAFSLVLSLVSSFLNSLAGEKVS